MAKVQQAIVYLKSKHFFQNQNLVKLSQNFKLPKSSKENRYNN